MGHAGQQFYGSTAASTKSRAMVQVVRGELSTVSKVRPSNYSMASHRAVGIGAARPTSVSTLAMTTLEVATILSVAASQSASSRTYDRLVR